MRAFYSDGQVPARLRGLAAALVLALVPAAQAAERITLLALFKDRAILEIDGARRVLSAGETSPEGVKLLAADSETAQIEIGGRREALQLGMIAGGPADSGPASVTLWASGDAFFAEGSINNIPVRFLVDTGATTVALNAVLANKLGLDYRKGQAGVAATASGYARIYTVKLKAVQVGDIVLHDLDAAVLEGAQPSTPLLGMSFLNRVEMRRDGSRMDLIKRY